jgi:muramoyltetrapeptide carboxypeptidase
VTTDLVKPKSLRRGGVIRVLSGSSCLGLYFPHRVSRGIEQLIRMGFVAEECQSLKRSWNGSAGTPEERAEDIHRAFQDSTVSAIVCAVGGITANQVLPLLDYELIRAHPKAFVGYSDNTLFHYAFLSQARMVSFYGPCLITEFAEFPEMETYTANHFLRAVGSLEPLGPIQRSATWTDEFLDWMTKEDLTRARAQTLNSDGNLWLKSGHAEGPVVGGCLPSLMQLRGTKYDVDYRNTILFLEVPEGEVGKGLSLSTVDRLLYDLRLGDVFSEISGLIIGRPYGYTEEQQAEFTELVRFHSQGVRGPVLANANIGHASPIVTVPLMMRSRLKSESDEFSVLESGVC